jgi:hypothetical protein
MVVDTWDPTYMAGYRQEDGLSPGVWRQQKQHNETYFFGKTNKL